LVRNQTKGQTWFRQMNNFIRLSKGWDGINLIHLGEKIEFGYRFL
jgi:hypothetical protein